MRVDKLAIYVPKSKQERQPIERLRKLAKERDRPITYMVMQAIMEYVERQERADARTQA